jgi:hypothetical protein
MELMQPLKSVEPSTLIAALESLGAEPSYDATWKDSSHRGNLHFERMVSRQRLLPGSFHDFTVLGLHHASAGSLTHF